MLWGNKYESVAVLIYEYRNNVKVLEFGCLKHPFINFLGASPDGITEDGIMLEIKCPSTREITGIPPPYYWCQVQGQLEVCELDRCDFLECKIKEYDGEEEYLNDNYDGGDLSFINQGVSFKPKTGDLVIFPGNIHYIYDIAPANGSRYIMPVWFDFI
jgi:hypothetical protein